MLQRIRQRMAPSAVILAYHRVAAVGVDPWGMCVSPPHFAEHLEVLRRHAHPLSLAELVRRHRTGRLPRRAVVVTFDDGYLDNLDTAAPMLARVDVPATVFLASGYLDAGGEFWWDELERYLLAPAALPGVLALTVGGERHEWRVEGDGPPAGGREERGLRPGVGSGRGSGAGLGVGSGRGSGAGSGVPSGMRAWSAPPGSRLAFYHAVWSHLLPLTEDLRREALDAIRAWAASPAAADGSRRPLTVEEVRALERAAPVEVGAHTVTHPYLPAQPAAVVEREVRASKTALEAALGHPVAAFAYPHGAHTPSVVAAVRDAGFACACDLAPAAVRAGTDPLRLPRFLVEDRSGDDLERALSRWFAS